MKLRAPKWVRFLVPLALVLLSANAAHAQRIPETVVWSAGPSLFAPFVAVPVKLGILRLLALEAAGSRLWSLSAIEWLLWFPVAFILFRYGRSSAVPLNALALLALAVWLHRALLANAPWRAAIFLSIPTPILALVLPFLAFGLAVFLEWLAA